MKFSADRSRPATPHGPTSSQAGLLEASLTARGRWRCGGHCAASDASESVARRRFRPPGRSAGVETRAPVRAPAETWWCPALGDKGSMEPDVGAPLPRTTLAGRFPHPSDLVRAILDWLERRSLLSRSARQARPRGDDRCPPVSAAEPVAPRAEGEGARHRSAGRAPRQSALLGRARSSARRAPRHDAHGRSVGRGGARVGTRVVDPPPFSPPRPGRVLRSFPSVVPHDALGFSCEPVNPNDKECA